MECATSSANHAPWKLSFILCRSHWRIICSTQRKIDNTTEFASIQSSCGLGFIEFYANRVFIVLSNMALSSEYVDSSWGIWLSNIPWFDMAGSVHDDDGRLVFLGSRFAFDSSRLEDDDCCCGKRLCALQVGTLGHCPQIVLLCRTKMVQQLPCRLIKQETLMFH